MGLLRNRRPNVRRLARRGDVDGLAAAAAFRDDLSERDGRALDLGAATRRAAVEALAGRQEPAARAALREAVVDSDDEVRATAIAAVREAGDEAAIGPLAESWRRAREAAALDALVSFAEPPAADAYAHALSDAVEPDDAESIRELLGRVTPEFAAALLAGLARQLGADDGRGERAAALLAAAGPAAVEPAVVALSDPTGRLRAAATLGALRDTRGVAPLVTLVGDADPAARRAAVSALGDIRDARAVQALLGATRDDDFDVRAAAVDALNGLGAVAVIYSIGALVRPLLRVVVPGFDRDWLPPPDATLPRRSTTGRSLRRLLGREG
jgi:HEAT repeat protein